MTKNLTIYESDFPQLEGEYLKDRTRLMTTKQWLEVFPEAKSYLAERGAELRERREKRHQNALNAFLIVKQMPVNGRWFWKAWIKETIGKELDKMKKEIKQIDWALADKPTEGANKVTEEMIVRAKQRPFDQILKFNRGGFCPCPFHSETQPSMSWHKKKNVIKCFGCGVYFDTIDYIIETQKVDFKEAVRRLQ